MEDPHLVPWVEKYRPKKVADVAHQEEVIATLKQSMKSADLPHLLFYGPPGTGKTSTILALAHELYGPELFKTRVMELNASDERGISVVRDKIKHFAMTTVGTSAPGYPSPPYKIIVLDEADAMTKDAQNALRRTMETYSKVTRFCLICNYITRIIDPLTSRCAKFRFRPLTPATMTNRLVYISKEEKLDLADGATEALVKVSGGDMRKAITFLQSAATLHGTNVNSKNVYGISGVIEDKKLRSLEDALQSSSFDRVQGVVSDLCAEGYSAGIILSQLHDIIVTCTYLNDVQKATVTIKLAEVDKNLCDGADEELQLLDLCAFAMRVFANMSV